MTKLLAKIGKNAGGTLASFLWFYEEPECPKSLLK